MKGTINQDVPREPFPGTGAVTFLTVLCLVHHDADLHSTPEI